MSTGEDLMAAVGEGYERVLAERVRQVDQLLEMVKVITKERDKFGDALTQISRHQVTIQDNRIRPSWFLQYHTVVEIASEVLK